MTLEMEQARKGIITSSVRRLAKQENVSAEIISEAVKKGTAVVVKHIDGSVKGIGAHLGIKVNANIGTSPDVCDIEMELAKLRGACSAGADTVMDLSTGGDLDAIRRRIIKASSVPVGSVPIYQAIVETVERYGSIEKLSADAIFDAIRKHAEDGISFTTVHCGVTLRSLEILRKKTRKTGIVSRGGAFLMGWMALTGKENPLYEQFDRLLDIARKYDLVLSLGDGLRPGCLADASDTLQMSELLTLGMVAERARQADVQVIIEGPGHIPMQQIFANVQLAKSVCKGAPLYLLGPIVTDVAPGYDHITAAIGGALAGWAGADFICYVTASEHLALPAVDDVKDGVVAARIAAHAADIAREKPAARQWDDKFAEARFARDWKKQEALSINPERFRKLRTSGRAYSDEVCSMCGKYCAMKIISDIMKNQFQK